MSTKPEFVYVTPAGFICTCGRMVNTITGTSVRNYAEQHTRMSHHKNPEITIVDYRKDTNGR